MKIPCVLGSHMFPMFVLKELPGRYTDVSGPAQVAVYFRCSTCDRLNTFTADSEAIYGYENCLSCGQTFTDEDYNLIQQRVARVIQAGREP